MLEVVATAIEVGKWAFTELGKPALESYVQDFFKDCLSSGVSRLNAAALKTPMTEAVGYFIKRFVKELQMNDVPETSIQHYYQEALKKFVQDKVVRSILGKAFEKDCKKIDYAQLEQIWIQQQGSGWQFPSEDFDWRGVCKEYVHEVKGIIKANSGLRDMLNSDLLEDIARNTAQCSPGFDVETYRASLQTSYGYLKLYTLDSTDRVDAIKLWAMFIEQTVREALPSMRYDLPLDLRQKSEIPENSDFLTQPVRKVLDAVADAQRAVILGDPGAGKSSLLQYLALEWVEGKTEKLPLLIELREFAINPSTHFLEFLHSGQGVDWQFDQHQLRQHLLDNPTLVMFDGLDEIFDRTSQATVIDDIIRFSQQYPKAHILVTSRIIGYNPDRLQHSGFRHFTIQSLSTDEIHEFIDRWYDLSMGSDRDKGRLKQRLKDAITNSGAIANLADNPLLLTMMAILNRRQELPRDRADLYDQASRVLLYHWDVDHKRLNLPMDAIGRREKQEMLRLIAYEMQAGEEGLQGNLISAEHLTHILTHYLRDQGFSEPRENANRLIQQLRERNFILCYRGADTYGFMHRTFLEYFCAMEIVYRFEKQRTLTFEELRDEIFGQHWQDETWHEVLRLVCGAIAPKFAGELIEFLLTRECDKTLFLGSRNMYFSPQDEMAMFLKPEGLLNLLLAADCLSDIKNSTSISQLEKLLLATLKNEIEQPNIYLTEESAIALLDRIARCFPTLNLLSWLQQQALHDDWVVRRATVNIIALYYRHSSITLPWLKELILQHRHQDLSHAAIWAIAENYKSNSELLDWFQQRAQQHQDWLIRRASMSVVFVHYRNALNILDWLKSRFLEDNDWRVQCSALRRIVEGHEIYPDILAWLEERIEGDVHDVIKQALIEALAEYHSQKAETLPWLQEKALASDDIVVRSRAMRSIAEYYQDKPETLEWLRKEFSSWLKESLKNHPNPTIRKDSFETLARIFEFEEDEQTFLFQCFLSDPALRPTTLQNKLPEELIKILIENNPEDNVAILLAVIRSYPYAQLRGWAQEKLQ